MWLKLVYRILILPIYVTIFSLIFFSKIFMHLGHRTPQHLKLQFFLQPTQI